jgi:hypothetical protein
VGVAVAPGPILAKKHPMRSTAARKCRRSVCVRTGSGRSREVGAVVWLYLEFLETPVPIQVSTARLPQGRRNPRIDGIIAKRYDQ